MQKGRKKHIKPQDVVLLLKIVSKGNKVWRIIDLSNELGLSSFEVTYGLERLKLAKLLDSSKRKINKISALEFLIHGLKYVFPAELGPIERGIATAHSEKSISKEIINSPEYKYVWPLPDGDSRGMSLSPLFDNVPKAVQSDKKLYRLLALVDVLRIGKVREIKIAETELKKEVMA